MDTVGELLAARIGGFCAAIEGHPLAPGVNRQRRIGLLAVRDGPKPAVRANRSEQPLSADSVEKLRAACAEIGAGQRRERS